MLLQPQVGDIVENVTTKKRGKISQVNTKWGWFSGKYLDGTNFEYRIGNTPHKSVRKLTGEELADFYLTMETMGILDSWQET